MPFAAEIRRRAGIATGAVGLINAPDLAERSVRADHDRRVHPRDGAQLVTATESGRLGELLGDVSGPAAHGNVHHLGRVEQEP